MATVTSAFTPHWQAWPARALRAATAVCKRGCTWERPGSRVKKGIATMRLCEHKFLPFSFAEFGAPTEKTAIFPRSRSGPVTSVQCGRLADTPMASASTFTEETAEQARVLSAYMTREFQYVSLAAEGSVSTARPEPDWEQALANKMLKREMRIKRLGSAKPPAVRISPPQSPGSSELHRLSHPVLEDFAPWHCESDDPRIGPDLADAAQAARTFYVLPRGRVYCNVRFSLLQSHDKITYTWITPSGRRFYRKTLVKVLAQKQTWSWNYIDLSEDRAQSQTGRWAVKVTVNGRRVLQASFNVLNDWIDVRPGILPIILLCPHGGRVVPAQCASRLQEQGEDLGCADTVEVVRNLASHLEYMFQVAPTVVYCKIHRRWLDVDAKEQDAYADSKMAPYYHAFYDALLACIRHTMTLQRRVPFILNLRAHHDFNQVVYASTLDGQTLWGMLERGECGDPRFANEGVNSRLAAAYQVIPANHHQRDDVTYGAGNLVRTFGRDHPWHADAIDVICPKTMVRACSFRRARRCSSYAARLLLRSVCLLSIAFFRFAILTIMPCAVSRLWSTSSHQGHRRISRQYVCHLCS